MLHTTAELAWNFKESTLKPGMSVGFTRTLSIALLHKAFSPPVI